MVQCASNMTAGVPWYMRGRQAVTLANGHASSVVAGRVLHRSCKVVRHGEDSQLERSWVLIVALLRQPILVDPVEGQKVHVIS